MTIVGPVVTPPSPHFYLERPLVDFERNALDIQSGIEFLRTQPGITKVVLFGHSGGGPQRQVFIRRWRSKVRRIAGEPISSSNAPLISPACPAPTD